MFGIAFRLIQAPQSSEESHLLPELRIAGIVDPPSTILPLLLLLLLLLPTCCVAHVFDIEFRPSESAANKWGQRGVACRSLGCGSRRGVGNGNVHNFRIDELAKS